MKKLLLSPAILFLLCNYVAAQLVANAGPDQTQQQCTGAQVILGGTPPASGGTPPYTYLWSPSNFLLDATVSNAIFSGWGVGTYSEILTVTDFQGNIATDTVLITIVFNDLAASVSASDTFGCVGNAVSFFSNVTGGNPPYTYRWYFGDATSTVTTANPQHVYNSSGNFLLSVDVWDTHCSVSAFPTPIVHIAQTCGGFSITKQDATCFNSCNGSATASPSGNFRYLWSNTGTTSGISNLCAGTYSVTVMDSVLTPLDTLSVTIVQPVQLFVATTVNNVICFGASNGAVVSTASGGTGTYNYFWNDGGISPFRQGLTAGTYTVTVADQNQCTATAVAIVNEPSPITATITATNESLPGACNGSIMITASGGTAPYSFSWSNASVGLLIASLCPGNYSVTITDANGCTATATGHVAVSCPVNTLAVSISSTGNIDCTHAADTLASVISGGTAPYFYWWTNGDTSQNLIVSQAGVYDLWVTDSAGCSKTARDTVLNLGLAISLQSVNSAACNGISNGMIKISVSGGSPAYNYLWSNGLVTDSISGIPSGTYTLTVTDAAQCTASFSYFLNQSSTNWSYYVYVNATLGNCNSNGNATANVYGGASPFTYLWSTTPPQATQTATGLNTGSYFVTVTGSDGCIRIGQTYIYTVCYNILQGRIINDLNGNCVLDSGETPLAHHSVIADGPSDYYGYTDAQGYYAIRVLSGTYTIKPYLYGTCTAACSPQNLSLTQSFSGLGDTVNNLNFYLVQAPFDLYAYQSWPAFRPGFTRTVYLYYGSVGADTVNGTLTFTYDADITFVSASNGGIHNASNRTIIWTFPDILPSPQNSYYYYYYYNNYVSADFLTPAGTPVGTTITNTAVISGPAHECDSTNNNYVVTSSVTNSADPNEKEVSPARDIYDESDSVLTYTIRFQNTGNDTAWFIVLKDTLSPHLNAASVQNIASSHPITEFTVEGEGILTWVFNPIYLVDSFTNEEASHGYVTFNIKKKSGLAIGTEIKNTAHIYFDYNEAVVTNTVTSKVADPNYIFTPRGDDHISVAVMPNPFSRSTQIVVQGVNSTYDFELFDLTGKEIRKISALNNTHFELKRETMTSGVYFYRITTNSKQRSFGKLVVE